MGIVLGRTYRQVLNKFGTPDRVQVVQIPVPGQGNTGMGDPNAPGGAPGSGACQMVCVSGGGPVWRSEDHVYGQWDRSAVVAAGVCG